MVSRYWGRQINTLKVGRCGFWRCHRFIILLTISALGIFIGYSLISSGHINALVAADPSTISTCGGNPECFAFSIDTRLTLNGATTGTSTTFAIPLSGQPNNNANHPHNWVINWGDGTPDQTSSDTGASNGFGISHNYAAPGQYQITIRPNGAATAGWMNAFGFGNYTDHTGANVTANRQMFQSVDVPFTDLMKTKGSTHRFAYMFLETVNSIGIPANLFTNVSTTGDTNLSYMFHYTFRSFAVNSTVATIPSGLFDGLDTSSSANFSYMFYGTFRNFATNSTAYTIPSGLFDGIDTSSGTTLNRMFYETFTSQGSFPISTVATVPPDLFSHISTASATSASYMFNTTFSGYGMRTANFSVNGAIVPSLTQSFSAPYVTKNISTNNMPSTNPVVNAGDVIVPTYNDAIRSIVKPGGTYSTYDWYSTDGTSCASATPTPDCGPQIAPVTFPDVIEWTPTVSTEKGNVVFYAPRSTKIVTFESNGGSSVFDQNLTVGSTVSEPADPVRSGYDFNGWYIDSALTVLWDFTYDTVVDDTILYAGWLVVAPPLPTDPNTPGIPDVPNTGVGQTEHDFVVIAGIVLSVIAVLLSLITVQSLARLVGKIDAS